jgi:hypothetical protein
LLPPAAIPHCCYSDGAFHFNVEIVDPNAGPTLTHGVRKQPITSNTRKGPPSAAARFQTLNGCASRIEYGQPVTQ